jgi:hypothetical protein
VTKRDENEKGFPIRRTVRDENSENSKFTEKEMLLETWKEGNSSEVLARSTAMLRGNPTSSCGRDSAVELLLPNRLGVFLRLGVGLGPLGVGARGIQFPKSYCFQENTGSVSAN